MHEFSGHPSDAEVYWSTRDWDTFTIRPVTSAEIDPISISSQEKAHVFSEDPPEGE